MLRSLGTRKARSGDINIRLCTTVANTDNANFPCDSLRSSQVPGFEVDEDEWKSKKEKMLEQGLDLHSGGNGGVKGRKKSKKDKLREAARREAAE